MMAGKRRWHYAGSDTALPARLGRVAVWYGTLAMVGACLLLLVLPDLDRHPGLLALALALLLAWGWLTLPWLAHGRLYLVVADDDGWCEVGWPLRVRRRRWSELLAVEEGADELVFVTADGRSSLPRHLKHAGRLLEQARLACGQRPPDTDEAELDPALVAGWLSVAPDGELVCAPRRTLTPAQGLLCLVGAALAVLGWAWWLEGGWVVRMLLAEWAAFAAVGLVGVRWLGWGHEAVGEVRATPRWLDVRLGRGWRRYAWGSLLSVGPGSVPGVQRLQTTHGDLLLPVGWHNADRLLHAIREALAAREAGLALPRLAADVPETALSRASVTVDAERGLSRDGESR